ncbi:MAG: ABC transporter substrate-binding protein [Candidatus Absconditicoccaceae bacterium]
MKKTISILLSGIVLLSTLSGCTDTSTQTKDQGLQTYKIGVIAPLSGPAANYGEDAVNAYKFIANKFNAENSGKIHIELIFEDGKCEGKSATSAAQKLISIDKVQVIVGGFCSAETIAAGAIAQPNKVVMLSPVSSSPDISNIGEYIFRFYNDADVTKKLTNHIKEYGSNKIFVLAENTDFSVGFIKGLKENFTGEVETQMFQKDEKDFLMIAKQIKAKIKESDFIVFLPSSDSSTIGIVEAFDKESILSMMKGKIVSNEIVNSATSYETLGSKLNGIKTTQLINLGSLASSAKILTEEMLKNFSINTDPLFSVLEADAMSLAIKAIVKAGNDGTAIKDYFTSFNSDSQIKGYFGNYYFTPQRDAHGLSFLVYEIQDGQLVNGK